MNYDFMFGDAIDDIIESILKDKDWNDNYKDDYQHNIAEYDSMLHQVYIYDCINELT
ncbi:unnamed protein product [marine sediment metagenome]|uniref:Uncharacterized protein n=1 Tax=marine sediment metagenome TaxID=412755 RepID=X0YZA5_9ZZZZ